VPTGSTHLNTELVSWCLWEDSGSVVKVLTFQHQSWWVTPSGFVWCWSARFIGAHGRSVLPPSLLDALSRCSWALGSAAPQTSVNFWELQKVLLPATSFRIKLKIPEQIRPLSAAVVKEFPQSFTTNMNRSPTSPTDHLLHVCGILACT